MPSAGERAETIRQRMEADIRRTLHATGMVSDFMEFSTYERLVEELVRDAMHHVEHQLVEISELQVAIKGLDDEILRLTMELGHY